MWLTWMLLGLDIPKCLLIEVTLFCLASVKLPPCLQLTHIAGKDQLEMGVY